jgi:polyphenol oxidase
MFFEDARGLLQSRALAGLVWLEHGFSTRHSAGWLAQTKLASLKQIHSDAIVAADRPGVLGEADALITNRAGLHVAVRTADCFPLLIADPAHRAVAAVHAGWRGAVGLIAQKTVAQMGACFGSRPGDLIAAIGPGIGACCFEVGPEVAPHFGLTGRAHADLASYLQLQLEAAGVERIERAEGECTVCRAGEYWSYRRDKDAAGRMWSGIAIKD